MLMASVVKKMECYNIRKSVKDLGEDLKEKIKAERKMIMSEMQEGIQMAMMTGQAMAFVVDKGVTLTRQILEALAKLMKMSALYTAPKIKNAWKRQPGAVSMDQIQRRIPIRINEADQQKFFDWMHRAEIPYCPLQDLNKNDIYAEFVIDERDILRLQSIVERNQRE